MGSIVITSRLGEEYREDLEQVMFFNPKQHETEASIRDCVQRYGVPEIASQHGYLRISFDSYSFAQTLYAIDRTHNRDILAGVIVFVRNKLEDMSILHVAIAQTYILQGPITTARLAWDLVRQVIDSASHIRGVKSVQLAYLNNVHRGRALVTSIPVIHPRPRRAVKHADRLCPDEAITCFEYQYCFECPEKGISKNRNPLIH